MNFKLNKGHLHYYYSGQRMLSRQMKESIEWDGNRKSVVICDSTQPLFPFFISWYVTPFCILSVRSFMEYLYMSIYFMECTRSLHHAYFPALVFSWLLSSTLFVLRVTVKVWGATALLGVNVFYVDSNGELKLLWCSAFSVKTLKTMDFHKTRKTANPGKYFW